MTKGEIRMRRCEAISMGNHEPGSVVWLETATEEQQRLVDEKPLDSSELLYGGGPGGGMSDLILGAERHHIACAEQVTGGAERCDCGVRPR